MQLKSQKKHDRGKAPNIEKERKINANCEGSDHQKDQSRSSSAALGHDRLGPGIESRIKAMGQEAHHRQNYFVSGGARHVGETQRPDTHL